MVDVSPGGGTTDGSGVPVRRRRRAPRTRQRDRGSVTAETVVVLPALVFVLVLALWAVSVASAQLRCVDASRTAARALARGEAPYSAQAAARSAAPDGSSVAFSGRGDLVVVEVHADVRLPGPVLSRLPGVSVSSHAVAPLEPGR
jgi:hypothetical protein